MNIPKPTTYPNGSYKASTTSAEAPATYARRTVFPSDPPVSSLRTLLYYGSRTLLGSVSPVRWLLVLLVAATIVWAPGWLPGGWAVSLLWLLVYISVLLFVRREQKQDFVRFVEADAPTTSPVRLTPDDKIPLHVTGYFSVEGKWQRFTWLPGFYRVFATRERALLCQTQSTRFLRIAQWPGDEVGMWYIFFMPSDVENVRWGELHFGREPRSALAIEYRVTVPARSRLGREATVTETIYLAAQRAEDLTLVLADLLHDLPTPALARVQKTPAATPAAATSDSASA